MQRITEANLEAVVSRINRMTGSPATPYTRDDAGRNRANVGNCHLDFAYGGVSLHRMENEAGGVSDVLRCGHVPKRELWNLMHAYISGLEDALELMQLHAELYPASLEQAPDTKEE